MRIAYIGCPFKTSYGTYIHSLKRAVEQRTGAPIGWVASNCGCGDPIEQNRQFETQDCKYFEMPHIGGYESKVAFKRWLRGRARYYSYYFRARRYQQLSQDTELVHLQQILHAYGSCVAFQWLQMPTSAAKVITIHELDAFQMCYPHKNALYNRAGAIIAHCKEMKDKLISLSVQPEKIHVIPHGVATPTDSTDHPREGMLFYGGHKLMSGKGIETLFEALALLKDRLGTGTPRLTIYGHYGPQAPQAALELARKYGVSDRVTWLNQVSEDEAAKLYLTSALLVLPYTGSYAGLPAGLAAAHGVPVVGTDCAGIPDHLGDNFLRIEPGNAPQLADGLATALGDGALRSTLARKLKQRVAEHLSWDHVAARTLEAYAFALGPRSSARALSGI
ncbi:MAG TPA: glycosyltransferase family 4 protein [Steroidobacteraceae bacterium]